MGRTRIVIAGVVTGAAAALPVFAPLITTAFPVEYQGTAVGLLSFTGVIAAAEYSEWLGRKFRKERYRFLIETHVKPVFDDLEKADKSARLNVMLMRGFFRSIVRLPRRLEFFYKSNMEGDTDSNLGLRADQGVAGFALSNKKPVYGIMKDPGKGVFGADGKQIDVDADPCRNFDQKARNAVAKLTLIYSHPIRSLAKQGTVGSIGADGAPVGVVNIDSSAPNAIDTYTNAKTTRGVSLHSELMETSLPALCEYLARVVE